MGVDLSWAPLVNALLNSTATVLLVAGRIQIHRKRVDAHRQLMLAAFGVSAAFLVLYVLHKAARGFENTPFHGTGGLRTFYLTVLATHVTLAMTVPVLAVLLIRWGLKQQIALHRRVARIAWPVWLYVSLTGVLIYLMLYSWNPAPAPSLGHSALQHLVA